MSEVTGARETEEFAALLRELKDRSGLSYGALAKRLHMSTSTLHRYCHGAAVPTEYAPVERLARVCRATPQELMGLHRQWVLADAARRIRADQATAARAGAGAGARAVDPGGTVAEPAAPGDARAGGASDGAGAGVGSADAAPVGAGPVGAGPVDAGSMAAGSADAAPTAAPSAAPSARGANGPADEPVVAHLTPGPASPRRRRTALVASAAVAALVVAAVLVAHPPWDGGGPDASDARAAGTAASSGTTGARKPSATPSPGGQSRTPSVSAPATPSRTSGTGTPQGSPSPGRSAAAGPAGGSGTGAVPLTVATRPYVYDNPCSQHFLVDSAPAQVGPPANEPDAPRWAAAYGAVSSGEQRVALTVQGTGADTVVLEALHVSVTSRGAPLAWNDYSMGVGCGGGVDSKSFDVDLDDGSPAVTVKNGQRDFPYKVSESDPEVFYVTAHTKAHDVRWDLTLDWSSGTRHGTVRVDNDGTPFRTSADAARPGYDYPLGGSDWIPREP